jgi:hypothetical protein
MADTKIRGAWTTIGDAMREVQKAEDELRAEQEWAWRRYVERVDAILAFDLQIEDEAADHQDATHLLDSLRARIDELRLQTRLGAMEGDDLLGRLRAVHRRMSC